MKNLFAMNSSLSITSATRVEITGPYELIHLDLYTIRLITKHFEVNMIGKNIIIEKLSEEYAMFSFDDIEKISVTKISEKEM